MNDMGNYTFAQYAENGSLIHLRDGDHPSPAIGMRFLTCPVKALQEPSPRSISRAEKYHSCVWGRIYGPFHSTGTRHRRSNQSQGDDGGWFASTGLDFPFSLCPQPQETGIKFSILMRAR